MIKKYIFSTLMLISFFLLVSCESHNSEEKAQSSQSKKAYDFNISKDNITVSGISSGGYMATQFHISHSEKIAGVAIIAGGPYWCARYSISRALGYCMKGGNGTDPNTVSDYVNKSQLEKSIDNVAHLKNDKVWIFHGANDIVMANSVSRAIKDFYLNYTDESNITTIYDVPVNHGMPTQNTGGKCDTINENFLNACAYDAAGEILQNFYGELTARTQAKGKLIQIDQSKYQKAQFADSGYLYVPSSCKDNTTCALHTVFHGCMQSSEFIGDAFVKGAGYNEWAESNNIVVFYPQVNSSQFSPMNPKGCWDWWGYTNEDYSNQKGPQIKAVNSMIDKISGVQ